METYDKLCIKLISAPFFIATLTAGRQQNTTTHYTQGHKRSAKPDNPLRSHVSCGFNESDNESTTTSFMLKLVCVFYPSRGQAVLARMSRGEIWDVSHADSGRQLSDHAKYTTSSTASCVGNTGGQKQRCLCLIAVDYAENKC